MTPFFGVNFRHFEFFKKNSLKRNILLRIAHFLKKKNSPRNDFFYFLFFSKLEKSPELPTIWKGCYFHILNTAKFGLNILMDDPPLQQHVKIEGKNYLGETARYRANLHPPQLTWFFTAIYPNLNHNTHFKRLSSAGLPWMS